MSCSVDSCDSVSVFGHVSAVGDGRDGPLLDEPLSKIVDAMIENVDLLEPSQRQDLEETLESVHPY